MNSRNNLRLKWYQITSLEFSFIISLLLIRHVVAASVFVAVLMHLNEPHVSELTGTLSRFDSLVLGSNLVFQFKVIVACLWVYFFYNLYHAMKFRIHHWLKFILLNGLSGTHLFLSTKLITRFF